MPEEEKQEQIFDLLIEDEMKDSYLNYAMSVIVSRALPDVRDGLKPSQRRILIAMNDLHLGPRTKFRKCAKIAGDTTGNYHPHGDQVIYPTLVRLAQPFACRYPLIDGQGNFGSVDGDPPAAMRYTEARLTAHSGLMLEDIEKDTVNMVPNYDETRIEPTVLPAKFPNLLCNGVAGIAVGMATSIPPHNFGEIADGIAYLIENPEATVDDLMKIVKGPDFPTGGIICGRSGIIKAYKTGKGHIIVRAKIHIEEDKRGKERIIISEIPYNQNKAKIIEKIADLVKENKIVGISDIRDESDRQGMRIVIELKKDENSQVIINQLYRHTSLQDTFSTIMIALVDSKPKLLNLKQILFYYIEHRKEIITRRTRFLLAAAEKEAHILEGLLIAIQHINEIIELIKKSESVKAAEVALIKKYELTSMQALAILRMQLQKLTGLEHQKIKDELVVLKEKIADYRSILSDEQLVLDIIREDIFEMKEKYTDERRTTFSDEDIDIDVEDLITEEDMVVTLSHSGYIKRLPIDTYRSQHRGGKGVIGADTKEDDYIDHIFIASTHDYILFFTNKGKLYWRKVYEIPKLSRQSKGKPIIYFLKLEEDEKITATFPVRKFDKGFIVFATSKGVVKKSKLSDFGNPRKGGIKAINLKEKDTLVGVRVTTGENKIILATKNGKAICFNETDLRTMGRTATGVRGVRLKEADSVIDMVLADEKSSLLTVTENGFGKRTAFEFYRVQKRGGAGIINIKNTKRNGNIAGIKSIDDDNDIILATQSGMAIRMKAESIRIQGRNTQGVRLISLKQNDRVVSVGRIDSD